MQRSLYLLAMVLMTPLVWAQDVISVRSGLIHRVQGQVTLAGKPVILDNSRFPIAGIGQTLEVSTGFVEVLLTPGAFLRLDKGGSFRMLSNSMEDTKIEVLSGTALVEVDELDKTNHISVQVGTFQTALLKHGLYYFDAEVGRLRVFDGKAQATGDGTPVELTKGRTVLFDPVMKSEKFKIKDAQDSLYAWSQVRAMQLSTANISASRSLQGSALGSSVWVWNPYMGMITFIPHSGYLASPFGMYYYNPGTVWIVSQPRQAYASSGDSSNSWSGLAGRSAAAAPAASVDSGVARSTPTVAAAAPAAAPSAPAATASAGSRGR